MASSSVAPIAVVASRWFTHVYSSWVGTQCVPRTLMITSASLFPRTPRLGLGYSFDAHNSRTLSRGTYRAQTRPASARFANDLQRSIASQHMLRQPCCSLRIWLHWFRDFIQTGTHLLVVQVVSAILALWSVFYVPLLSLAGEAITINAGA